MDAPETSELRAFLAAVDGGSVSAAARELGLPRATVSRRLGRLEERLGVELLHRTTRRVHPTDAGRGFAAEARGVLEALERAVLSVQPTDSALRGLLRVSTMPLDWGPLRAMVDDFLDAHPELGVELRTCTEHVDMAAHDVDVAIRAGARVSPGLIAHRLGTVRTMPMAAPAYLTQPAVPSLEPEPASPIRSSYTHPRAEREAPWWGRILGGRWLARSTEGRRVGLRETAVNGPGLDFGSASALVLSFASSQKEAPRPKVAKFVMSGFSRGTTGSSSMGPEPRGVAST